MTRIRIALAAAACLLLGAIGAALGQGAYQIVNLNGGEQIGVTGIANGQPAPLSAFITANSLRATTSYQLSTATTGTVTANSLAERFIFSGTAPGTVTVDAPATPPDGSMLEIINGSGGAATAITLATTDGSTIVGTAACGALAVGGSCEFQYTLTGTKWYRLR